MIPISPIGARASQIGVHACLSSERVAQEGNRLDRDCSNADLPGQGRKRRGIAPAGPRGSPVAMGDWGRPRRAGLRSSGRSREGDGGPVGLEGDQGVVGDSSRGAGARAEPGCVAGISGGCSHWERSRGARSWPPWIRSSAISPSTSSTARQSPIVDKRPFGEEVSFDEPIRGRTSRGGPRGGATMPRRTSGPPTFSLGRRGRR
jgi:hypothetical protein